MSHASIAAAVAPAPMYGPFFGRSLGHSVSVAGTMPGAPVQINLMGAGVLGPLGHFRVSASLTENMTVAPNYQGVLGTVVFTNRMGTITASLSGPPINAFVGSYNPTALNYNVTSATGAYANLPNQGPMAGTMLLALHHVSMRPLPGSAAYPGVYGMRLYAGALA